MLSEASKKEETHPGETSYLALLVRRYSPFSSEMDSEQSEKKEVAVSPPVSLTPVSDSNDKLDLPTVTQNVEVQKLVTSSPQDVDPRSPAPRTPRQLRVSRISYTSLCFILFLGGWNDGATGTLLPRIREVYEDSYILVSLIFVSACFGFLAGSVINLHLTPWLGFGKSLFFGSLLQVVAYAIQAAAPPYPLFVICYAISGCGFAIQDAHANGFVAQMKQRGEAAKMGGLHACYGLGLFISPLVSTQFAQIPRWSFHFLVSLGLALMSTTALLCIFKLRSLDVCLVAAGETPPEKSSSERSLFGQVMRSKEAHLLAVFVIAHLGVVVTISGWIVTFIIEVRGGGPTSGYISAGVSAGSMLGRIALLWINKKVGERNVIFLYSAIVIAMEFVIWFVPSLIGNAVAVCFAGLCLGPMYPLAVNQAKRILPGHMLTGVIGWMAGFGQTGSALLPFMTGAIASKHGLQSMPPLLVGMTVLMMGIWALVPATPRRSG
ncbi:unnamed protein product [Cyclocybe aegerita]|uniref:Major facilitator superfamily (MFS) profile domain-containing protein n=1 Tax=Cyclocybe aegerita TaxID=1973307 RepID=A0A8S0WBM9_CYCAE|nr:unnamed protein product [Cyclocybe aegerita]